MPTELALRGSDAWTEAAALIQSVYAARFGAAIEVTADELCVVRNRAGKAIGAAGLKDAGTGFFSEIYLDGPVESCAAASLGRAFERGQLFEVVTLATISPVAVLPLVSAIVSEGRRRRKICSIFTATERLRRVIGGIGLGVTELGQADPRRVANARVWGSYYDNDPRVCLILDRCVGKHPASCRSVAA